MPVSQPTLLARTQPAPPPGATPDLAPEVAEGLALDRRALDGLPGEAPGSFVRVWPPSPGTVDGDRLGFLRYLTRDPAAALEVQTALGYSLTLDRAVTAPNAVVGVAFDRPTPYRSQWVFLTPGETYHVPGGFNRFWLYNADQLDQVSGGLPAATRRPIGYCAFLVGTRRNGLPPRQAATIPLARVCGLFAGAMTINVADALVPVGRARKFALTAWALDAGGVKVATAFGYAIVLGFAERQLGGAIVATSLDAEGVDNPNNIVIGASPQRRLVMWGENGTARESVDADGAWFLHFGNAALIFGTTAVSVALQVTAVDP